MFFLSHGLFKGVRFSVFSCYIMLCSVQALSQYQDSFRICTFNIQNFGNTKLHDKARVNALASVIRKYDIVAVQEISDVSGNLPKAFCSIINGTGNKHYEVSCSQRTGRQPDDKTSQEQYAFYYDTTMFAVIGTPVLYPDSVNDYFAREPYIVRFRSKKGNFSFVLITIHTTPLKAVEEIGSLDEVVKWVEEYFPGEKDVIVVGDFNASCTYASPAGLDQLAIRGPGYFWVVPDDAKTNLSEKSDCAYDRFVLTTTAKTYYTGHWGVDRCFTTKSISDHWPVWAEFKLTK